MNITLAREYYTGTELEYFTQDRGATCSDTGTMLCKIIAKIGISHVKNRGCWEPRWIPTCLRYRGIRHRLGWSATTHNCSFVPSRIAASFFLFAVWFCCCNIVALTHRVSSPPDRLTLCLYEFFILESELTHFISGMSDSTGPANSWMEFIHWITHFVALSTNIFYRFRQIQ